MKIEKLNEDKIKITLSIDDLEERNIDVQSFIYNSPESQDLFWDMMQEAEQQYGFNVDESMIYVEASSSGSGIFTLVVTKTQESLNLPTRSKIKKEKLKLKRKAPSVQKENSLYEFLSFDDICEFCKIIDVSKIENSSLYKLNEQYYLRTSMMPYNSILEYANLVKDSSLMLAKINEYGNAIIEENAINEITNYFIGKKKKCSR